MTKAELFNDGQTKFSLRFVGNIADSCEGLRRQTERDDATNADFDALVACQTSVANNELIHEYDANNKTSEWVGGCSLPGLMC